MTKVVMQQSPLQTRGDLNTTLPQVPQHNQMENVIQTVDYYLQMDSAFPHLADMIKASHGCPTVSGLNDNDYPNLNEFGSNQRLSQFSDLHTIPLPSTLLEQFDHVQQKVEMGLFTEITRAWLTIDSNIYLWAYDNGSDVAYYDSLNETILSVGLIKPKPGVFKSHIKYLLCLITAVEIQLLGVTFNNSDDANKETGDLLLVPEAVFTVSTDNTIMTVICGTLDGRVFLGGKDGCVYEVVYQADNGWFSRKCRKINHSSSALAFLIPSFLQITKEDAIIQIEIDQSRHILYTLTENGNIEVYDLGSDGTNMSRVITKSLNSIAQEASYVARTIDATNFRPIQCINAIEESESLQINLIGITKTGVRFYFAVTSMNDPEQRPFTLSLVHIRLPPGFSASSPLHRPTAVHLAKYKRGNLLMISAQSEDKDILWAINGDSFPFENNLTELYTVNPIGGKIWRMAEEEKCLAFKPFQTIVVKQKVIALEPPSLVTQHMEEPRKFVFMSSQGVHIGFKPRIVDQFRQLLLANQGFENDAVKSFFTLHKGPHGCAIALIVACGCRAPQDEKLREWATLAFFRYGGEPQLRQQSYPVIQQQLQSQPISQLSTPLQSVNQPLFSSPSSSSQPRMSQLFVSPGNVPSPIPHDQTSSGSPVSGASISYSDKHNGVYLYFARIIRPIWNYNTVRPHQTMTNEGLKEHLTSAITTNEITMYELKLSDLKNFLKSNVQFTLNEETPPYLSKRLSRGTDAQMTERNSLYMLYKLIEHCIEVLGLWRMLCDHQFHVAAAMLPIERQTQLKSMTFRELIVFGSEMTTMLASCLVRRYIEDNATTDIINSRLQDLCPSIYKLENALHAKAHELVMKSKTMTSAVEKEEYLQKALDLCIKIGARINLAAACELFQSVHWYEAIVNLCLITAQKRDPQNLALHYYRSGEQTASSWDTDEHNAWTMRNECYRLLLEIYERLIQQSKSLIMLKTTQTETATGDLSADDAKRCAENMIENAITTNDELFHNALYNWLYEHHQSDKLLDIKSPFLEEYLKRKTSAFSGDIALMDLLWRYYEKNGHFRAAAQLLSKLAERRVQRGNANIMPLYQRIEYLSRAIVCMKSSDSRPNLIGTEFTNATSGEFLHELEEKMEVSRIQLQILETLQKLPESHVIKEAIIMLDSELFDISQLYSDFADRYNLPECQLAILFCAGHYDPTLIETLWQNIIDNEIRLISPKSPETQHLLLKSKIESLGKLYISTERYFPIGFIVKCLEIRTQNLQFEPQWLIETLINLRLTLPLLLDVYHKLYKSKEYGNLWPHKSIQILKVIVFLIKTFLDTPNSVPQNERRTFTTKCLDVISGYLMDIQPMASENNVREIIQQLKYAENRLRRDM